MELGGYFQSFRNSENAYYKKLIRLNTGRNAFEYILDTKNIKKIFIPYYICDAMLEPLKKLNIEYNFYYINNNLEIENCNEISEEDYIVYVNYYGIKGDYCKSLSQKYKKLIIDNTQAFFEKPIEGVDTIYSCRKFFPVADGSYLATDKISEKSFKINITYDSILFLYKKFEMDSESAYSLYLENEEKNSNQEIKYMSKITENFLNSFPYDKIKLIRERNFLFFHNKFKEINKLKINIDDLNGPLVYPLYIEEEVKTNLIKKKFFVASYWNEVLERVDNKSVEYKLTKKIIPIPIDHRYEIEDLKIMVKIIFEEIYNYKDVDKNDK